MRTPLAVSAKVTPRPRDVALAVTGVPAQAADAHAVADLPDEDAAGTSRTILGPGNRAAETWTAGQRGRVAPPSTPGPLTNVGSGACGRDRRR
jgi:hypothetical protein